MQKADTITAQLDQTIAAFTRRFGRRPRFAAVAPGRVNLIGEHTDYCDGFVLPIAIERYAVIVADRRPGRQGRLVSLQQQETAEFEIDDALAPGQPAWSNYVTGVVRGYLDRGYHPGGFDAMISSTVPIGGGLSSSAALEVAAATLLETMIGQSLDAVTKALLCQQAEHDFAGVPCGIMDQFISVMAQPDHAMLLDCREQKVRQVSLSDPAICVLIINSQVRHELAAGEYAKRRAQCALAARSLKAASLRDVTIGQLNTRLCRKTHGGTGVSPVSADDGRDARPTMCFTTEPGAAKMDAIALCRARHVVTENARTQQAADALDQGDWMKMGALMFQSHASLRDDFQVSCRELDVLVELAGQLHEQGQVYGARLTGGGFGGCTVNLVPTTHIKAVKHFICDHYHRRTGIVPTAFATRPVGGAHAIALEQ